jgi:hypothetical protein
MPLPFCTTVPPRVPASRKLAAIEVMWGLLLPGLALAAVKTKWNSVCEPVYPAQSAELLKPVYGAAVPRWADLSSTVQPVALADPAPTHGATASTIAPAPSRRSARRRGAVSNRVECEPGIWAIPRGHGASPVRRQVTVDHVIVDAESRSRVVPGRLLRMSSPK